ncbi:MAG TPA: phage portal protein, partial [Nitrospiraceae bacterium]|nr:phage portal protein [Nitrospiraceae bacterium]
NPGRPQNQRVIVTLYDDIARYILTSQEGGATQSASQINLEMAMPGDPFLNGLSPYAEHGMDICPVSRFLYEVDLDGEVDCQGEVEPIIPIQDQINFTTFNEMMAEQYEAFKQRWVTGMAPVDEEGKEKAPFRPGVDRVWAAEDPATKFGEFGATELAPYSGSREDGIRHMATITQVPPYHLLGQIANLSAEALAAARDGLDRKVEELQSTLTDPWRGVFRLSALAAGDKEGWNDLSGEIVWRNTSARAFAATIDGLGKAAQMLGIPVEELWTLIPGATADDVNRWVQAKQAKNAEQVVKDAISSALQSQPQYTNVKQQVGGGPNGGGAEVSVPVQIPAGTSGKVTGATASKSENMATGGGGVNVH